MSYPAVYRSSRQSEGEFLADYDPNLAAWSDGRGMTLLMISLRNPEPSARFAIASRLLDDGADPSASTLDQVNALHVLLSATSHDFTAEPTLLHRLLEGGADINADSGSRWGSPLQTLSRTFKFSDAQLAPFYDLLFTRAELDVTTPSSTGRSVTESARAAGERRADLLARCRAHILACAPS